MVEDEEVEEAEPVEQKKEEEKPKEEPKGPETYKVKIPPPAEQKVAKKKKKKDNITVNIKTQFAQTKTGEYVITGLHIDSPKHAAEKVAKEDDEEEENEPKEEPKKDESALAKEQEEDEKKKKKQVKSIFVTLKSKRAIDKGREKSIREKGIRRIR